ncbi:MAG: enoyl-CoA hydratase-related protein [Streptosporangiaceae bacterium]
MTGAEPEVRFIAHGAVAQLVLNRPAKRNAVTPGMARLLEEAVDRLERSPELRVGVLSGEGAAAFCAGADLGYISRGEGAQLSTERGGFAGFVRYPRRKPIIAAVHGYALAGGFEIALACDLLVAERTARFGLPEVTRGLIANGGGLLRLASSLPRARALDLILTGRTMAAAEAAELGLVSRLAEPGQGLSEALRLAGEIAANAPAAVRESLFVANAAAYTPPAQTWELCAEIAQRLRAGADAIEGATAFLERRDPAWTGHQ